MNTPLRYTNVDQWQVPGHQIFFHLAQQKPAWPPRRFSWPYQKGSSRWTKPYRRRAMEIFEKKTVHNDNVWPPMFGSIQYTLFLVVNPELESKRSWSKRSLSQTVQHGVTSIAAYVSRVIVGWRTAEATDPCFDDFHHCTQTSACITWCLFAGSANAR